MVVDLSLWDEWAGEECADARRVDTFEDLYKACYPELVGFCRRLLRGRGDAEAIAQEAFVRAWTSFDRYAADRPFWPWLATIARRLCIDHRRRSRREDAHLSVGAAFCAGDEQPVPEEAVESDEEYRAAREALQSLKPAEQRVITLCDVNGWSYDEIARFEGVTVESIRGSLKRARASLRRSFARAAGGAPAALGIPALRRLRARVGQAAGRTQSLACTPATSSLLLGSDAARAAAVVLAVLLGGGPAVLPQPETALLAGSSPDVVRTGPSPADEDRAGAHGRSGRWTDDQAGTPATPPTTSALRLPELPGDGANTPEDTTVTSFTPSPSYEDDGTVFAVGTVQSGCPYASCAVVFRSSDRGKSWTRLPSGQFEGGTVLLPSAYPADKRIFVAGPVALQVSDDDGASFSPIAPVGGPAAISPDFSNGDPRILLGSAPGWEYRDDVRAMRPASLVVPSVSLNARLAFARTATNGVRVFAGGTEASSAGKQTAALFRCDGSVCTKAFSAPDVLGAPQVAVSPDYAADGRVALWRDDRLFLSRDGGSSFAPLPTGVPGAVREAAFDRDGVLYVATEHITASGTTGGVVAVRDGDAPRLLGGSTPLAGGASSVTALPDGRLLAAPSLAAGGGLLCSLDGGVTWGVRCT